MLRKQKKAQLSSLQNEHANLSIRNVNMKRSQNPSTNQQLQESKLVFHLAETLPVQGASSVIIGDIRISIPL